MRFYKYREEKTVEELMDLIKDGGVMAKEKT